MRTHLKYSPSPIKLSGLPCVSQIILLLVSRERCKSDGRQGDPFWTLHADSAPPYTEFLFLVLRFQTYTLLVLILPVFLSLILGFLFLILCL